MPAKPKSKTTTKRISLKRLSRQRRGFRGDEGDVSLVCKKSNVHVGCGEGSVDVDVDVGVEVDRDCAFAKAVADCDSLGFEGEMPSPGESLCLSPSEAASVDRYIETNGPYKEEKVFSLELRYSMGEGG